jgi:hypothetical protein
LALEALLSTIRPVRLKPNGRNEGDWEWFLEALKAANELVPLESFAPTGSAPEGPDKPMQDLRDDLYVKTRTALFHAKAGRKVLLPHHPADRDSVLTSLKRLAAVYLALADQVLGARPPGPSASRFFFRLMGETLGRDMQLWFTDYDSEFDPAEKLVNPRGKMLVPVVWQPSPQYDTPKRTTYLGEAAAATLGPLPFIASVAASDSAGTARFANVLRGRLEHEGLTRVEALVGWRGTNAREGREDYLT